MIRKPSEEPMKQPANHILAIIWDYDGTLVDTRHKNLNVTKKIIERISGKESDNFPALRSVENYHAAVKRIMNWRELYQAEFDLTEAQIDAAGALWAEYQLNDDTEVPFCDGIEAVLGDLVDFPHGIVSQNSKQNITEFLDKVNFLPYFKTIIGYEEVDFQKQKPNPGGLLRCIDQLTDSASGHVLYIGDHAMDAQCAHRANQALRAAKRDVTVVSIGAFFIFDPDTSTWQEQPDYEIQSAEAILDIVQTYHTVDLGKT